LLPNERIYQAAQGTNDKLYFITTEKTVIIYNVSRDKAARVSSRIHFGTPESEQNFFRFAKRRKANGEIK
jgi:hypothetical protein